MLFEVFITFMGMLSSKPVQRDMAFQHNLDLEIQDRAQSSGQGFWHGPQ